MNNFYFIESGFEDIDYQFITNYSFETKWMLIDVPNPEDYDIILESLKARKVSNELEKSLLSAKKYEPAIALATSSTINICGRKNDFSIENIEKTFLQTLNYHLENQKNYPFFLARSKTEDIGWLIPNMYYWLVGYKEEENIVYWISYDNYIYDDSKDEFDVSYYDLVKLKEYPKKAFYNLDIYSMSVITGVGTDLLKFKISLEEVNEIFKEKGKLIYEYNDGTERKIYRYLSGDIDILIKDDYGVTSIIFNDLADVKIWDSKGSELKKLDEKLFLKFLKSKAINYKVKKDVIGNMRIYINEGLIIAFDQSKIDYIQVYDPEYKVLD